MTRSPALPIGLAPGSASSRRGSIIISARLSSSTDDPARSRAARLRGPPRSQCCTSPNLHFGSGEREDVDWKTFITHADRETRRHRLAQFLRSLPRTPDYVIVSGDVTIAGREDGFRTFVSMIDELIKRECLPPVRSIVVVPGNHDVSSPARPTADIRARLHHFEQYLGRRFVRPWLAGIDPPVDHIATAFAGLLDPMQRRWGGIVPVHDDRLGTSTYASFPFLVDRDKNVLIYAFNSASIAQTRIDVPDNVRKAVEFLRAAELPNKDQVTIVLDAFESELRVDPARIDPQELSLFAMVISVLRRVLGDQFDSFLKMAVLHHHVGPILTEEVKKFELLLNAGRFKSELHGAGFHVIMHGHKHWPKVFHESSAASDSRQPVVSGRTIAGGETTGTEPGFFRLDFPSGPVEMLVTWIPLRAAGSPTDIVTEGFGSQRRFTIDKRNGDEDKNPAPRLNLRGLFAVSEESLLARVREQRTNKGESRVGWSHALDENRVSVIATAYGLRILSLVGPLSSPGRQHVAHVLESLREMANPDGGWSASSQSDMSRPEPTAFVLWALHAWEFGRQGTRSALAALEKMLGEESDVLWRTTFSLATTARILAEIAPTSTALPRLPRALIDGAVLDESGRPVYWGAESVREIEQLAGAHDAESVVHTAHAMLALTSLYAASQGAVGTAPGNLASAQAWLLEQEEWPDASEEINRPLGTGKYDKLSVRHFTVPWVVIALLRSLASPEERRIREAIRRLYSAHRRGLWTWGPATRPIWATHDALYALREYAFVASRA